MADVLSDVLRAVRLRGTVYFRAHFHAPWAMDLGQKNVAVFHVVTEGRCWLKIDGEITALSAGEVILFPHGSPHTLLSSPDEAALPAEDLLASPRKTGDADAVFGGSGEATTLVCGHYESEQNHPLLKSLPNVVRVSIEDEMFVSLANLVVSEAGRAEAGTSVVVDRLAEALLLTTLRTFSETAEQGFVAALADQAISGALSALHEDPAGAWTVETLARAGGVSRSVFAERFRRSVGESPMQYVARWRMHHAQDMLSNDQLSLAQVANQVGYDSEFAFSKAFKRVFGIPPGQARKRARASG